MIITIGLAVLSAVMFFGAGGYFVWVLCRMAAIADRDARR